MRMLREEAIRHIEAAKLMLLGKDNQPISDLYYALDMAIKALESCEDAISREATLEPYNGLNDEDTISVWLIRKNIEQQPPVNLQPKTGHWIFDEILDMHYYCSECKSMGVDYWDFCPYCGAKMGELESEE